MTFFLPWAWQHVKRHTFDIPCLLAMVIYRHIKCMNMMKQGKTDIWGLDDSTYYDITRWHPCRSEKGRPKCYFSFSLSLSLSLYIYIYIVYIYMYVYICIWLGLAESLHTNDRLTARQFFGQFVRGRFQTSVVGRVLFSHLFTGMYTDWACCICRK